MGVESLLRGVGERLSVEPMDEHELAHVRLTFKGRPVIGSRGIFAEFGMKAGSTFSDAASTVAASLSTALAPMGPCRTGSNISSSFGSIAKEVARLGRSADTRCGTFAQQSGRSRDARRCPKHRPRKQGLCQSRGNYGFRELQQQESKLPA